MAIKKEFSKDKDERATSSDLNNNFQEIDNKFRTNIIKDKTGTPRVLIGEQKDGFGTGDDYGIKVSQAGSDVTTAADKNLVLSSAFNMFKIVGSGSVTITVPSSYDVTSSYSQGVNHNLGFIPQVIGFVTEPVNGYAHPIPYTNYRNTATDIVIGGYVSVLASSSVVTFSFKGDASVSGQDGDYEIEYYLLEPTS